MRWALSVSLATVLTGCAGNQSGYTGNPSCKQQNLKCEQYRKARKQAGKDTGTGLEILRAECEEAQRDCADAARHERDRNPSFRY